MPQYSIANADAFDSRAEGAKVPDMSMVPSATSWSRDVTTIAANSKGVAYWAFRAQPSAVAINGTSQEGTVQAAYPYPQWPADYGVGPGGNSDPAYASMVSNYMDVRTVAMAIKLQCIQPALTAQGFVHIAVVPEDMSAKTWSYPQNGTGSPFPAMERAPYYQKFPVANLINNTVQVQCPIMDEGAFRYRYTGQGPASVAGLEKLELNIDTEGISEAQVDAAIEANDNPPFKSIIGGGLRPMYWAGTVKTQYTAPSHVNFPVPFDTPPAVQIQRQDFSATNGSQADPSRVDGVVYNVTNTGFDCYSVYGGSPGSDQFNWIAIGRPPRGLISGSDATVAATLAANSSIETTFGWCAIIVALEGVTPGANCLEVEAIRHYEGIPSETVGNIITATAAAPFSSLVTGATKAMQQAIGPFTNQDDGSGGRLLSGALNALYTGATAVAGAVSPGAAFAMSALRPALIPWSGDSKGKRRMMIQGG